MGSKEICGTVGARTGHQKLMEATHGEERTKQKEELRDATTNQIDLGAEDLEEDDQYLMELVLKGTLWKNHQGRARNFGF